MERRWPGVSDGPDASGVMRACNVDLTALKTALTLYVDTDLAALATSDGDDAKPTAGFQRVIQRAVIHVQSSGREEVPGAHVLVAGCEGGGCTIVRCALTWSVLTPATPRCPRYHPPAPTARLSVAGCPTTNLVACCVTPVGSPSISVCPGCCDPDFHTASLLMGPVTMPATC